MTQLRSTAARQETLTFSVDAALLRELGERLVGKAHIALAELIKNSYDADATVVDVVFGENSIVVRDNGHGMSYAEFESLWMRIGSPHKQREEYSRTLRRPLTGSKGVGRLAAQFLARDLELRSVSAEDPAVEIVAEVDWEDAVSRGNLTEAEALVMVKGRETAFPGHSAHGTWVQMTNLKQEWGSAELTELARELWPLQPPFDQPRDYDEGNDADEADSTEPADEPVTEVLRDPLEELLAELDADDAKRAEERSGGAPRPSDFEIRLRTRDWFAAERFERQMRRVLDLWTARIRGRLEAPHRDGRVPGMLHVDVEFSAGGHERLDFPVKRQALHGLDFEIRVFSLQHRQRYRVPVEEAREYLRRNGGVHVYDAGFHLPYYGAETDWLNIERDHANRLTLSQLLPEELNVRRGLNALPTNRRLYGIVRVDTSQERRRTSPDRRTRDALTIQVSRDRLVDNRAYQDLSRLVRLAIDFYAVEETRRRAREASERPAEPPPAKAQRVREVLESHRADIPREVYNALNREIDGVLEAVQTEAEQQASQAALLGTLATAGIAAIAYEHEFNRQLTQLDRLARQLRRTRKPAEIDNLSREVQRTIAEARAARRLFSHLLADQDTAERKALRARPVLDATRDQLRHFMRGVKVDHAGVPADFRLPPASLAEWGSLFQNVYVNAVNSMIDSERRRISATADVVGRRRRLLIQDTGSGVDIESADELFEPFERRQVLSDDRRQLGFGGSGLGLTIVRMLATRVGCTARFTKPDSGFKTAFELAWEVR